MRLALLGFAVILGISCAGQTQGGCSPDMPRYSEWSASQRFPVTLQAPEQQALAAKLAKLRLGMSMDEVKAVAGAPSYVADGERRPYAVACFWAYSFDDPGPKGSISKVVQLGFTRSGTLAIVMPVRVEGVGPSAIVDASCEADTANSSSAVSQAMNAGKIYLADRQRQAKVMSGHAELTLGMSIQEVENLLGKPGLVLVIPHGDAPFLLGRPCQHELKYIFRQQGQDLADSKTIAISIYFDDNGKLFWARAQNVKGAKEIGKPAGIP